MRILLATEKDVKDIADILNESWSYAYENIIPQETILQRNASRELNLAQAITDENDNYYIVRYHGTPIATFCIGPSSDKDTDKYTYEVIVMYVRPSHMRQGFGKKMMKYIVKKAKHYRMKKIKVWVLCENLNAIAFYYRTGFVPDGAKKIMRYGKDMELMRMEKYI